MSENKFDWYSTECAPKKYPMEIISGTFIYKGEQEHGLYIPSGGTLTGGWGSPTSSHVVGEKYKRLPDRLKITFFSYAEKQFYQGEFELPYEKILALFQKGVADNPEYPTYQAIMAGIAPGGVVAVWVTGSGDYTEVFFGKADKVDLNPSAAFRLPFKSKADADKYMEEGLEDELTKEEIAAIRKNGIAFDLWARYRDKYHWNPTIKGNKDLLNFDVIFLNAESIDNWKYTDSSQNHKPPPRTVFFESKLDKRGVLFEIEFDDIEIINAFEKLGKGNQKVFLEFDPKMPRSKTKIRLYNDKESIELKKYKSKDW